MDSDKSPFYETVRNDLPCIPKSFFAIGSISQLFAGELQRRYPKAARLEPADIPEGPSHYIISDASKLDEDILALCSKSKLTLIVLAGGREQGRPIFSPSHSRVIHEKYGLTPHFMEPIGKIVLRNTAPHSLRKMANKLPVSRLYSPYMINILTHSSDTYSPYRSRTTTAARLSRLASRSINNFKNHPIHDTYCKIIAKLRALPIVSELEYKKRIFHAAKKETTSSTRPIVFITGHLAVGGVEKVLLNITADLATNGHNIIIYTTIHNANEWAPLFEKYARIIDIPKILGHKWPDKAIGYYLRDSIVAENPSLILITNSTQGYAALPHISKKIDTYVVDLLHTYGTPREKGAFLRISHPFRHYINQRIVISKFLQKHLIDHYGETPERIKVIYNSPDAATLDAGKKNKRSKGNKTATLAYFGRLQSDKSPDRLVRVAYELRDFLRSHNIKIAVYGDGNLRDSLESLAKSLGVLNSAIEFMGPTKDPVEVMSRTKFSILVSDLEGIPMSILESMAVGTPVISTSVGGVPEIITHAHDGILVEVSGKSEHEIIQDLAEAVRLAILMPASEYEWLSSNSRDTIRRSFSSMNAEFRKLISRHS